VASSSARTQVSSRRVKALLLSPIVVLFASAAGLLIISNYDTTTATTLAASSGVVGTLLGTIVPLLPLFLPNHSYLLYDISSLGTSAADGTLHRIGITCIHSFRWRRTKDGC
jgi:hypothetical protein